MREILFRGKRVDNGEWALGYYCFMRKRRGVFGQTITELDFDTHYIVTKDGQSYPVIPETVGEYTGLKSNGGKKIFEGDIIREWSHWHKNLSATISDIGCYLVVCDYLGSLYLKKNTSCGEVSTPLIRTSIVEVIGNIHDNPELLEVEE